MNLRAFTANARAALVAVGLAALFAQAGGFAAPPSPPPPPVSLPYAQGYLVTGNYVVGGVDMQPGSGGGGSLTDVIHMTGVPRYADGSPAEILSAYLHWETIVSDPLQLNGVRFRGQPITPIRTAFQSLTGPTASCYSSGGGSGATYTMYKLVADVRPLLPLQFDVNGRSTGRRLVTDADLANNLDPATGQPYSLHTVTLPESGTGNQVPQSAGASLVVVYRDPREPLRRIVAYDGIAILPNLDGAALSQSIRGIFQSSPTKSAKLTHIAGSGQPNGTDRVFFKGGSGSPNSLGTLLGTDRFLGTSSASDRAWANLTFEGSAFNALLPGATNVNDGYGESVTTIVDHTHTNVYDCLSWGAIIFSAAVKDNDRDGLPDGIEDNVGGLRYDASGALLPDLNGMGASSSQRDIFIQMDAMRTLQPTTYGDPSVPSTAPYSADFPSVTVPAHNHLPTPEAIRILVDPFLNAPPDEITNAPIRPHVDVGELTAYRNLGAAYQSDVANDFLVSITGDRGAKGGHLVLEQPCGLAAPSVDCQFRFFPGWIGQLSGLTAFNQASGADWTPPTPLFDPARNGLIHQVLYAHSAGTAKSPHPCLDPSTGTNPDGSCNVHNPDFHVPRSTSGFAQVPGGKLIVALGLWDKDNGTGTPHLIASTTFHEFGHNGGLYHGGDKPRWDPVARLRTWEPNCKTDYLSSMSYAFQSLGLTCDEFSTSPSCAGKTPGDVVIDYSRDVYDNVDENSLSDGSIGPLAYRTAWFAPLLPPDPATNFPGNAPYLLQTPQAKRFCSGAPFPDPLPANWVPMYRVDGPTTQDRTIDWQADGNTSAPVQNVNLDANADLTPRYSTGAKSFHGFNDWLNIRLDQIGGGKAARGFSVGDEAGGTGDEAGGNGDEAGGNGDEAGGTGDEAGGTGDEAGGTGDEAGGTGDEFTFEKFADSGFAPPTALKACVIGVTQNCPGPSPSKPLHRVWLTWKRPVGGSIAQYHVYSWRDGSFSTFAEVPGSPVSEDTFKADGGFLDNRELPDGQAFTYVVSGEFDDVIPSAPGHKSKDVSIIAVNDPPIACGPVSGQQNCAADSYAVNQDGVLNVAARGVLSNDRDLDSKNLPVVVTPDSGRIGPSHGTLTINVNGSFTYTPIKGYSGPDQFTYKARNGQPNSNPPAVFGLWIDALGAVPLSPDSNVTTVNITVLKKKK